MFAPFLLTILSLASLGVQSGQVPLNSNVHKHSRISASKNYLDINWKSSSPAGFSPVGTFNSLHEDTFTTLTHPAFPKHAVRIKKSNFCDATVNSFTGYIDIQARHLFFYFFESRSDPENDDVIFWTNGGPGASSSLGLFMELGPCRILDSNSTEFNPYSWNSNANLLFVDQPIGVGFSFAEYGETVSTTEEAAKDIAAFISVFFEHFTKFKGNKFHMTGESYAGRYLPLFASEVYDQNAKLIEAGLTPINLDSVMIGNGLTDYATMVLSYYDIQCTPATIPPFLDISTCVQMKKALPRCRQRVRESCIDVFDSMNCLEATTFCESYFVSPFFETGINPYDISRACEGGIENTLCYPITRTISDYLSRPDVRKTLGVDPSLPANFSGMNFEVSTAFAYSQDIVHQSDLYVAALLERGVRVLIYVGLYDWICNHVGNERWTLAMDWSGKEAYGNQELREWNVDGEVAGKTRSYTGFTFATVYGAGHMVPYDKPKVALQLLNRWISNTNL